MKLTLQTDYALRILMVLNDEPDRTISVDEISRQFSISKNHLMKVAQALSAHDFIKTERGRNGGLRLAMAADEIRIGAVVSAIEPDMNIVECYQNSNCALLPNCRLKPLFGLAARSFIETLNQKTLSDICI